ncbi:MAG: hypothetical protein K2G85_01325 [Muribaculaceae bacterium]|nr:hypothetical protein [Muribaculaceae bacterium]
MRRLLCIVAWVCPMVFLAIGCADDLRNPDLAGGGEEVKISFSVDKNSDTRGSTSQDWECLIDHAYLLFYGSDTDSADDKPVAAVRAVVKSDSPDCLVFKIPPILEEGRDYRLVAIANADSYVPGGYSSYADYLDARRAGGSEIGDTPLHIYNEKCLTPDLPALPMTGSIINDGAFSFTKQNGACQVNVALRFRRAVARIDMINIVKQGFDVEGIAICNRRDATWITPSDEEAGSVRKGFSEFFEVPEADDAGIQKFMGKLYCFPSAAEDASLNDEVSTGLILKAVYGEDSEPSYYRVNIAMSGNHAEVKGNTKYCVTIQSVKGRGAATPEEAYASDDSLLVLSMVEDWDLEVNYAMDDNGNFVILSRGNVEFSADAKENVEIKVLTSRGLVWHVEYLSDDAPDAFSVSKISETSLVVSPVGENQGTDDLTGRCRVSALTSQGNTLQVDILLRQLPAGENPDRPVIPWEKDFALVPLAGYGVKVDHDAKTIEIDGFNPDCFNSFIDIPFQVYIREPEANQSVALESSLQWPLEGRLSKEKSEDYCYTKESFVSGSVVTSSGNEIQKNQLWENNVSVSNGDIVYISVGAMAPDDPAIKRSLKFIGSEMEYHLTIKPRDIIIDDVLLTDNNGKSWLILDRNVQEYTKSSYAMYVGRKEDGIKYQTYNYSQSYSQNDDTSINIPFKYKDESSLLSEDTHEMYFGKFFTFNANNVSSYSRSWLDYYLFDGDLSVRTSPFYEKEDAAKWSFPDNTLMECIISRMKVSKLRIYLVSEIPVKNGKEFIPICCYWPYRNNSLDFLTYGYYTSKNGNTQESSIVVYIDGSMVKTTNRNSYNSIVRMVRELSEDELTDYKTNYLGYGSQPHKLTICHPDTYTSPGWIAN